MTNACENLDLVAMMWLIFASLVGIVLIVAFAMVLFTYLARWLRWGK